jgi:Domain of unknown function (DUF4062)
LSTPGKFRGPALDVRSCSEARWERTAFQIVNFVVIVIDDGRPITLPRIIDLSRISLVWRIGVSRRVDFEAMGLGATEGSKRKIDEADVYVGIYAHRYGYIEQGHDKSVTEIEFDYAGERNIERLCFVVDPKWPWPPDAWDYKNQEPLQSFKARLGASLIRGQFTTVDDLRVQLMHALVEWKGRHPGSDGVDHDEPAPPAALASLAPPTPPLFIGRGNDPASLKARLGIGPSAARRPAHRTGHADFPHPALGQDFIAFTHGTSCPSRLRRNLELEGAWRVDKFLVMSRKGKRLGVAFASTPRGEGGAGSRNSKPNERKQVPNPDPAILTRLDDLTTLRPATSEEIQPGASIISPSTWLAEIAQVRLGV